MKRLTAALVGFLAALALVAGLLWAGLAGALPGVRLAMDWPPLLAPGIVHRAPRPIEAELERLLAPAEGSVGVERFTVSSPGSGFEVWAEAFANGRRLGRPFQVPDFVTSNPGDLALALAELPDGLRVGFVRGDVGWQGVVQTPMAPAAGAGMSGTFHDTPTALAPGQEVPLLWWVRNAGDSADALPVSFRDDPLAGVRDPASSFAGYDFALVIWCGFPD